MFELCSDRGLALLPVSFFLTLFLSPFTTEIFIKKSIKYSCFQLVQASRDRCLSQASLEFSDLQVVWSHRQRLAMQTYFQYAG